MMVAGYSGIMRGLDRDWPGPLRMAAFLVLFEGLGVLLAGQHRFTGLGAWVSDQGKSFQRFAITLPLVVLALMAVPVYLAPLVHVSRDRGFFAVLGLSSLGLALIRPWWFWHSPQVVGLRGLLSDWGVKALYTVLGAGLIWAAIFARMPT